MIRGLTPEINKFYQKNQIFFLQDFFRLKDIYTKEAIPFTPYTYQIPPLLDKNLLQAWLWPRRAGKTTIVSANGAAKIYLFDDYRIIVISPRQRQSDRIISFAKHFISNSPYKKILLGMTKKGKGNTELIWSKSEISLSNGSGITSLPEGEGAISALGEGGNLVLIDEVGRLKDADNTIGAIQPIILDRLGSLVLISTSWGKYGQGRKWYEICNGKNYKLHEANIQEVLKAQSSQLHKTIIQKKREYLKTMKEEMGDLLYNMQFMNSFEGGMDVVFDPEKIKENTRAHEEFNNLNLMSIDLGKSMKTGDKSVIALMDASTNKLRIGFWRNYQQDYRFVLEKAMQFREEFNITQILVDGNTGTAILEHCKNKGYDHTGIYFTDVDIPKYWRDKGIRYYSTNKNKTVHRTQIAINNNSISFPPMNIQQFNEFVDYSSIITTAGNISYSHIAHGHDDHVDVVLFPIGVMFKGQDSQLLR